MLNATVGIRLSGINKEDVVATMQLMVNLNITWGNLRQDKMYWYVIGRINDPKGTEGGSGGSYIPREETIRWD